jgi:hypothetical protein
MPLFNNRAGNAGTGKGFLSQIGHKRAAVKNLKLAAQTNGYNNAYYNATGKTEPSGGQFGGPSSGQRLNSAAGAAKSAGLSNRKINKVVGKAREIGNSYGQEHAAFGASGKNPFRG